MKILLLLLASVCFITGVDAQSGWTVQLDGKELLKATVEDTAANVVTLDELMKGSLVVTYKEPRKKGWGRTLMVYDEGDNQLASEEGYSLTVSPASLKKWAIKGNSVKVFTVQTSLNPKIAIRARRVHLCTINFF